MFAHHFVRLLSWADCLFFSHFNIMLNIKLGMRKMSRNHFWNSVEFMIIDWISNAKLIFYRNIWKFYLNSCFDSFTIFMYVIGWVLKIKCNKSRCLWYLLVSKSLYQKVCQIEIQALWLLMPSSTLIVCIVVRVYNVMF